MIEGATNEGGGNQQMRAQPMEKGAPSERRRQVRCTADPRLVRQVGPLQKHAPKLYSAAQHSTAQHSAAQHSAAQHSTHPAASGWAWQ